MGTGIAIAFLNGGMSVTLQDVQPAALSRAMARIREAFDRSLKKGSMSEREVEEWLGSPDNPRSSRAVRPRPRRGSGYEAGSRKPSNDPDVEKLISQLAQQTGIKPRNISDEEIITRTHEPMIDAGKQLLEEGIANKSSDIDAVWILGYGLIVLKR